MEGSNQCALINAEPWLRFMLPRGGRDCGALPCRHQTAQKGKGARAGACAVGSLSDRRRCHSAIEEAEDYLASKFGRKPRFATMPVAGPRSWRAVQLTGTPCWSALSPALHPDRGSARQGFDAQCWTTTLRLPPSGWIEDSHLQALDHARHTRKKPRGENPRARIARFPLKLCRCYCPGPGPGNGSPPPALKCQLRPARTIAPWKR